MTVRKWVVEEPLTKNLGSSRFVAVLTLFQDIFRVQTGMFGTTKW